MEILENESNFRGEASVYPQTIRGVRYTGQKVTRYGSLALPMEVQLCSERGRYYLIMKGLLVTPLERDAQGRLVEHERIVPITREDAIVLQSKYACYGGR